MLGAHVFQLPLKKGHVFPWPLATEGEGKKMWKGSLFEDTLVSWL